MEIFLLVMNTEKKVPQEAIVVVWDMKIPNEALQKKNLRRGKDKGQRTKFEIERVGLMGNNKRRQASTNFCLRNLIFFSPYRTLGLPYRACRLLPFPIVQVFPHTHPSKDSSRPLQPQTPPPSPPLPIGFRSFSNSTFSTDSNLPRARRFQRHWLHFDCSLSTLNLMKY